MFVCVLTVTKVVTKIIYDRILVHNNAASRLTERDFAETVG